MSKKKTVAMIVCEAAGLTASTKRRRPCCCGPDQACRTSSLVIEAGGRRCRQIIQLSYLGGEIRENADTMMAIKRRARLTCAYLKPFVPDLYDMTTAPLRLNVRMVRAKVIEDLLCGCRACTLSTNT